MPPKAKGRADALTRQVIIDAALTHLAGETVESMSVRRLAADLGVSPMALYRHVRTKDKVLLEVVDALLAPAGVPSPRAGWRRCLTELATSLHVLLRAHPELARVFLQQPVTTPTMVARLEGAVAALERAGLGRAESVEAYAAVHTYTIGFGALAGGRASFRPPEATQIDPSAAPILSFVTEEQFRAGLRLLLDGIAQRLGT